jgi:ribosomal 50S subunit-recycling heat shock protein
MVVRVLQLAVRRGPAPEARTLYETLEEATVEDDDTSAALRHP